VRENPLRRVLTLLDEGKRSGVSDSEPFYMPDPDVFGHSNAYVLFTGFAAKLEMAGLADRFPRDTEVRHAAIELLAQRHQVEDLVEERYLIPEAIEEARYYILERRGH
jgi:hypothetical protein